ncbi:hypothetical protein ACH9D2_06605 [Kocuria sp. M4R2S49]|uniref:hypothetical protein n=1 Tax=Kocuria rhizosphaericola TaxID=3376284 RepID=UPI0037A12C4B
MAGIWTCKVVAAGPAENGAVAIWLMDTANPAQFNHWFTAVSEMKREMLSVALTAISTGFKVDAHLTGTAESSTINRLYLMVR